MPNPAPASEGEQVQELKETIEQDYGNVVKEEADKAMKEDVEARTAEIGRVRDLGFVTNNDLAVALKEVQDRNKKIESEFTKLREFLLRRKSQGKSTIPNEEKPTEEQELKDIYTDVGQFD